MLEKIILYSVRHKLIVLLFVVGIIFLGLYSLSKIPIGSVPDVTNNQVQILTTSRNLATEEVEKFLTYPIELEMANLPNVKEIRSISKFGLSVVTVVFEDQMGSYIPRQLIAEKLKSAEEKIPKNFGTPFLGPISTGLGEIYQYTLEVDSLHQNSYSLTDLRTIQDWYVKRQLSGIPGVVEVNTWGGHLKQYEVSIQPQKLKSLKISLSEVYKALSSNNSIVGGGYIEKRNQAYFIKGEGLIESIDDIENTFVTIRDGIPVYIKDVSKTEIGHAARFGAITGNGEGEKVLGQVMMLKGASAKDVIESVNERVELISSSLPAGVKINPFLNRSELINKTTYTIAENLILGFLIVVFVVVLFLGNFRSGLVVASVIPLCLLFALSLMYFFGVNANLMSLGAIDFGIIIDGGVIVVEYIAFKISSNKTQLIGLSPSEKQTKVDEITVSGTKKMMHAAVFGQLIIIIVFIPILSLIGVEGKMFRPMALVFCFALVGAILLCFTYVPVMASLFIRPSKKESKYSKNTKVLSYLKDNYRLLLNHILSHKEWAIGITMSILVCTVILFSRMGGEFIPTLDEGDFVIQPVLKTGTSLSATIGLITQMEEILKTFPEVDQVVTRIGAAEVPTDPMSMEESDIIIKLNPKPSWSTAKTKNQLAEKFKEALSIIPGIEYEFTQPIEMRFNELITGVRADLAIKVFGENLDVLYAKAQEIETLIQNVEGADDITVEKIIGLPQMTVDYDRSKMAKYGINIDQVNDLIISGFGGRPAGTVFEGEKQFDLVLRFDQSHRSSEQVLENTSIQTAMNIAIPLSELAEIKYTTGPAKISRDNTKRRIVVGVNVRNRDLESVVDDVRQRIDSKIDLPVGYTIEYGGQFENLQKAKSRLLIAVPLALFLIFILLYVAFKSFKEALIIFTAIPFATVGGVLLLIIREMPFSISAGVGFIALFGIAVLNGIVLIEEFKSLKKSGIKDTKEVVLLGTQNRLRPVLLTASAAALGFMPMVVSTSAGAEVQKPLATVVVGGLVSATLLTLLILPVLYTFIEKGSPFRKIKLNPLILFSFFLIPAFGLTQETSITLEDAIEIATNNNSELNIVSKRIDQQRLLLPGAYALDKTEFFYNNDQNNIAPNTFPLRVWGINQSVKFPTFYNAQRTVILQRIQLAEDEFELTKQRLIKNVSLSYYEILYWERLKQKQIVLDSLYGLFLKGFERENALGERSQLELLNVKAKKNRIAIKTIEIEEEITRAQINLNQKLQTKKDYKPISRTFERINLKPLDTISNPGLKYYSNAITLSLKETQLEKQKLLPDLNFSFFRGTNSYPDAELYNGIQVGVALPLWVFGQKSKINAAKTAQDIKGLEMLQFQRKYVSNYNTLLSTLKKYEAILNNYHQNGKELSQKTVSLANKAFKSGEIDFSKFLQLIEDATLIETEYLSALLNYNKTVLEINYLIN